MEQKTIHFTECDDLQITSHLNMEALPQLLQDLLPDTKPTELTTISGSLQQKQFYDSLPQSFSRTDADGLANTLGVSARTVDRWLTNWTQQSMLQRVKQGEYSKVS